MADVREGKAGSVPPALRDGHYPGAAKLGNAQTYVYPHGRPGSVVQQQYPPDELVGRDYYQPTRLRGRTGTGRTGTEAAPHHPRPGTGREGSNPMTSGSGAGKMMAVQIRETGGPEVLQYVEIDVPEPGPGEVAVQIGAAGVNFIDIYHRQGVYPMPMPFVPGREGAGRVIATGSGVTGVAVGDRVAWLQVPRSYAEVTVGPADRLIPVPDALSDEQAAALALQGLTAQSLATDVYRIVDGDDVLIHAGAGGVGLLLTQIAKIKGAGRVITTVSTPDKAELSRAAGADEVIIGYDGFATKAWDLTDGRGMSVVYDGVGQGDLRRLARGPSAPRHDGAVRRRQRPGAALRHPTAEQGRFAETDPAERRSLRPGHPRTAGPRQGRLRLGRPPAD